MHYEDAGLVTPDIGGEGDTHGLGHMRRYTSSLGRRVGLGECVAFES